MGRRANRLRDRAGGYVLIEAMAALVLSGLVLAAVPIASDCSRTKRRNPLP